MSEILSAQGLTKKECSLPLAAARSLHKVFGGIEKTEIKKSAWEKKNITVSNMDGTKDYRV